MLKIQTCHCYLLIITFIPLTVNDKVSLRFYYNLGVEYYKLLQHVYGTGTLMAMIDGDMASNYDQPPSSDGDGQQVISDLQQLNIESNDIEVSSPKVFVSY